MNDPRENNKSKKSYLLITVVILLVGAVGYIIWRNTRGEQITYKEAPAKKGTIRVTILSTGTVQPENRLEIRPPVAGRVEDILVVEGQKVKKGQVLALMSSAERAALIDTARAEGPEELKKWEDIYRASPIVAPINGTIILRTAQPGQSFTPTDDILVMSDRLTVKAQVDETDIALIKLKQPADIILDAYSHEKIPSLVDQIAYDAKTVSNVTTYIVDVLPIKTPAFMRSGMTANVSFFIKEKEDILTLPTSAILTRRGNSVILVKLPNGKPEERDVETGVSDGKSTEIVSGISEGEIALIPQIRPHDKKDSSASPFGQTNRAPTNGGGAGGRRGP